MATKKKAVKKPGASRVRTAVKKQTNKPAAVQAVAPSFPRIGAPWPGQGGNFAGIIRGEKGQPDYALVVPTHKSAKLKGVYGPASRIQDAENEYDGLANTTAMAAAGSDVAKRALALRIDGHADFYIMARHEARIAYINAPDLFDEGWHWTSTQYRATSDYAWVQDFGNGHQYHYHKDNELPVRAVRRVPIQ